VKRLFVWVRGPEGTVRLAGELAATDPAASGRFDAEFEYSPEWVNHPGGFALDPVSLPLRPLGRRYRSEQFHPPLAMFDDALPDDWGRGILTRALKSEGHKPSPAEMLLRMQGAGTGALQFTESPSTPTISTTLKSAALATLLLAAREFEAGNLSSESAAFRQLLEGSSRAGGARPKALVHDDQGEEWVAKFPSKIRDGIHDVVGLEATCLELARQAGLIVPESRLQFVGQQRVLLVRRFDVTTQGGRHHMISMRTLCRERPGISAMSYSELASVLGRHSASPAADVAMLFRHMVFNAATGNVDDHLKNFWALATGAGYRLAPAFDLVPDVSGRREHTLSFQYGFGCPTAEQLLAVAAAWNVEHPEKIVAQVTNAVAQLKTVARKLKVRAGKGIEIVEADVRRRLELIGSSR
jgi:serine/threonine-protein kinase HipA